jgi:putative transposase
MHYRRANTKGGTYFFTVNLHDRKSTLLVDEIDLLRTAFYRVKKQHPFIVNAIVVLPEHIHAIMTLPANDSDFAKRWSLIKAGFSRQLPKFEKISHSRA